MRMNKLLLLLMIIILVISSCAGGNGGETKDEFPTGFDGVDIMINVISHGEDQEIHPKDIFEFEVELNNNGEYDSEKTSISVQPPSVLKENEISLNEERSLPKGDYYSPSFKYNVTGVPGGGTKEVGNLIARVCYNYESQLTISACRGKPKAKEECDIQSLTNNNQRIDYGQGAPIWIESVDELFVNRGEGVVPKFNIRLNKIKQDDDVYRIKEGELCGGERNGFDYKIFFSGGLTYDSREEGEQDFICNPKTPTFEKDDESNDITLEIKCELKEGHASTKEGLSVTSLNVEIFYDYASRTGKQLTFTHE